MVSVNHIETLITKNIIAIGDKHNNSIAGDCVIANIHLEHQTPDLDIC